MAYTPPTASDLKARYPAFNAVADNLVTAALNDAARMVDESWTEGDFANARMLYACHLMTLDGLGTEAAAGVDIPYGVKILQAGDTKIERFASTDPGASAYSASSYGQRFADLLKRNKGGPLTTSSPIPATSFYFPWGYWGG